MEFIIESAGIYLAIMAMLAANNLAEAQEEMSYLLDNGAVDMGKNPDEISQAFYVVDAVSVEEEALLMTEIPDHLWATPRKRKTLSCTPCAFGYFHRLDGSFSKAEKPENP